MNTPPVRLLRAPLRTTSNTTLGLRKLCRSTHESLRRPDSRQGSYFGQFEEMTRFHEKLADNGYNFGVALQQMHDELVELGAGMERSRKQLKQFGMSSEKKVHDAELLVEKVRCASGGGAANAD